MMKSSQTNPQFSEFQVKGNHGCSKPRVFHVNEIALPLKWISALEFEGTQDLTIIEFHDCMTVFLCPAIVDVLIDMGRTLQV